MDFLRFDFEQFTSIATLIIAVCAFFSPIVTCLLNNRHQYKLKKLEYAHQDKLDREKHISEIYDGYIQAADACIQSPSEQTFYEFGRHSGLAMRYVPDDIRAKMIAFEKSFYSAYNPALAPVQRIDMLNEIISLLRQLKELPY